MFDALKPENMSITRKKLVSVLTPVDKAATTRAGAAGISLGEDVRPTSSEILLSKGFDQATPMTSAEA